MKRIYIFFKELILYFSNHWVNTFPCFRLRLLFYRTILRMNIGRKTVLQMGLIVFAPRQITIGSHTMINRCCLLEARGGITIKNHVSIAADTHIYTSSHDPQSPDFAWIKKPVIINEYAWIGARSTILPGVTIGKGAVVGAGSVVTNTVSDYTIVAGNPAREIGTRTTQLHYLFDTCHFFQ